MIKNFAYLSVGKNTFHPIAGFNAYPPFFQGEKNQDAFILPFFPDAPGFVEAIGVFCGIGAARMSFIVATTMDAPVLESTSLDSVSMERRDS